MSKEIFQALADHYQKTYELTYDLWKNRNSTFLILIGVTGTGALLADELFRCMLTGYLGRILGITEKAALQTFHDNFPFSLLKTMLLLTVFYLIVHLYYRTTYILRNYSYLARLEAELRNLGGLEGRDAFTREGAFYWQDRGLPQEFVRFIYSAIVGGLLAWFLISHFTGPNVQDWLVFGIERLATVGIGVYFLVYAWTSWSGDTRARILGLISSSESQGLASRVWKLCYIFFIINQIALIVCLSLKAPVSLSMILAVISIFIAIILPGFHAGKSDDDFRIQEANKRAEQFLKAKREALALQGFSWTGDRDIRYVTLPGFSIKLPMSIAEAHTAAEAYQKAPATEKQVTDAIQQVLSTDPNATLDSAMTKFEEQLKDYRFEDRAIRDRIEKKLKARGKA